MAAYTASVTGNWADTATWGGSGPPGDGDTVTISNGITVTIPVSTSVTVGASPADDTATAAISRASSSGTGKLIVNGTLIFRGSVRQGDADWEINEGAIVEHDSSQASVPADANYTWQIGANASGSGVLTIRGTTGSGRAIFRNAAGSGRFGGFTGDVYLGRGGIDAEFASFESLGADTSTAWLRQNMRGSMSISRLVDCLTDDCSFVYWVHSNMDAAADVEWQRTSFKNPTTAYIADLWESSSEYTPTGNRVMQNCIFDGNLQATYFRTIDFDGTAAFGDPAGKVIDDAGSALFQVSSWGNALIVQDYTVASSIIAGGTVSGVFGMRDKGASEIDFFRGRGDTGPDFTYTNFVCAKEGGTNDGEWLLWEGIATTITVTVTNGLVLPCDGDGGASGALVTRAGEPNADYTITVNNNTAAVTNSGLADEPVICQTESTAVKAGTFESVQNNLVYNGGASDRSGYVVFDPVSTTIADDCYTTADYNGSYQISGDQYAPTDAKFLNSPPGANDIVADPQFVDDSITLTTWATGVDPSVTTWDQWWAEVKKMNDDSGYNPDLHWMEFYAAARAGFTPQNTALQGAGYDGSDIGAIAVTVSSAIRKNNSGMLRRVGRVNQLG